MLSYKSYTRHVSLDDEADLFHGEVVDLKDVITFQATTVEKRKQAFRDSVDDYFDFAMSEGNSPTFPSRGA